MALSETDFETMSYGGRLKNKDFVMTSQTTFGIRTDRFFHIVTGRVFYYYFVPNGEELLCCCSSFENLTKYVQEKGQTGYYAVLPLITPEGFLAEIYFCDGQSLSQNF